MKEYFEIDIDNYPIKTRQDISEWCEEFVGRYGRFHNGEIENWTMRIGPARGDRVYVFAREADATMFVLKWK